MLFPQLQSRFIPSRNVLFASRIIQLFLSVFGCFHGPQGFLPSGPDAASLHPQPWSLPCRSHQFLPNLLLGCLLYNAWQKAYQSASTNEGPNLSGSMWLTFINAFEVFTSSAFNVNSSGLSLTITSELPSGTFGFRTWNVPVPRRSAPTSRARSLSTLMNSRWPSVRPLLLSLHISKFLAIICRALRSFVFLSVSSRTMYGHPAASHSI